ncbi:hypothetical protein FIU87_19060 [Bacillus sp. THAF10]|uniref:hypothetical protein n=1 Tax=Bacillus sp. THAF10 TaxID=2587848 RepID=UPI0012684E98|nr:hypothetical protein [Bacillus sp. THAF10]QFT90748.1 hypothetical protein FIU87_19060 [Bacillus sp. THAF10]
MLVYDKWRVHPAVIPLVIFSGITAVVFGAGLLNIMPFMVWVIFLLGLLLALYYLFLFVRGKVVLLPLFTPATVVFLASVAVILLTFQGVIHSHYDDFSHWGLIVKEMFQVGGLPDGRTTIGFKNYPPGSATFLFYILTIVGYAESYALMAQAFFIAAALSVLFIFVSWKNAGGALLAFGAALSILAMNGNYIYTLLVDGLLGMVALAITVIAFYYREDWRKSVAVNAPILILLLLIKDSGKLFFLYNICLLLYFVIQNQRKDPTIKGNFLKALVRVVLVVIVIPLSCSFLWGKYVDKVYQEPAYHKFDINRSKILNVQENKSAEFIQNLGPMLIDSSLNFDTPAIQAFFILNVLVLVSILYFAIVHKRIAKVLLASMIYANAAYVFYLFTLYSMYLFLMPENEAVRLAGFLRYLATIIIYCAGVLMAALVYEWSKNFHVKKNTMVQGLIIVLLSLVMVYPLKDSLRKIVMERPDTEDSIRLGIKDQYQKLLNANAHSAKVLYYSPESLDDRGYLDFILKYVQLNRNFTIARSIKTDEEMNEFQEKLEAADYLVIVDQDHDITGHIAGFQSGTSSTGIYKIMKTSETQITLSPIE